MVVGPLFHYGGAASRCHDDLPTSPPAGRCELGSMSSNNMPLGGRSVFAGIGHGARERLSDATSTGPLERGGGRSLRFNPKKNCVWLHAPPWDVVAPSAAGAWGGQNHSGGQGFCDSQRRCRAGLHGGIFDFLRARKRADLAVAAGRRYPALCPAYRGNRTLLQAPGHEN